MASRMIRSQIDLDQPPQLTPEEWEEAIRLADYHSKNIDLSDIPEASDEGWKRVKPGRFTRGHRQEKPTGPIQIEPDIISWFQANTQDYNLRINEILRKEIASAEAQPDIRKTA